LGNLGIGVTSPSDKLDINGGVKIGSSYVNIGLTAPTNGLLVQGNVGIGTTSPTNMLDVAGGVKIGAGYAGIGTTAPADGMLVQGSVGIGTSTPGYALQVGNAGDGTEARANAWNSLSDSRLKTNLESVTDPLGKIQQLTGYFYNWKNGTDKSRQFGLLAQDVENVLPEVVSTDALGYKSLDYGKLTPLLIEGIKAQQTQISQSLALGEANSRTLGEVNLQITENSAGVSELQTAVNDKLNIISQSLALGSADSRTLGVQVDAQEQEITDFKTQLAAAETKLQTDENNLATFETATNDTLSSMLETENMLTERVLNHEDRLKALEDKLATMTVSAGGKIPDNVLMQDKNGNVQIAGIFEAKVVDAKGVVAGSYAVKNTDEGAPTTGDGKIASVKTDADGDGWDDELNIDGKGVKIETKAVSETAKVFVTFEGDPGARYWVEKTTDSLTGEFTGFKVNLSEATKQDVKFSWWIVESK
jgi:hypothetical protein